jgi:hypothetical protein
VCCRSLAPPRADARRAMLTLRAGRDHNTVACPSCESPKKN